MPDITKLFESWMPQVLGKYINEDWEPKTQGYGAQCWDIPANWSKYLGLPVINTGGEGRWPGWAGNMADAFPQSSAIAAAYQKLSPDTRVEIGDILVWDDSYFWYPKTHVAIGVQDLGAQVLCVSQNSTASQPGNPYPQWTTGPATLQHLPRKGLLAIIRPRVGNTIQPQGTTQEEDELSAAEVKEIKEYIHALLIGGYNSGGREHPGIGMVVEENQRRITGIKDRTDRYLDAPIGDLPEKVTRFLLGFRIKRKGGNRTGETTVENTISYLDSNLDEAKLKGASE
jgi:hypothetical protein